MSLFDIIGDVFGKKAKGPDPEEIAKREQRLAQQRLQEEELRKEEMKREKVRQLRRISHDSRIVALFEDEGFEYDVRGEYLVLYLPCSFKVFIKVSGRLTFISAQHYANVAKLLKEFISEYQDLITDGSLAFGVGVKLPKAYDCSRLTFSLPLGHTLVLVVENRNLETEHLKIISVVNDMTGIFVELLKRAPSSKIQFHIER